VVVNYPPGGGSLPHRHAASAFIYAHVLSGAVRSQVGDEPAKVYHSGEGFYEMPGSHHRISENSSDKEPASLLAIFVVDSKHEPLTIADQGANQITLMAQQNSPIDDGLARGGGGASVIGFLSRRRCDPSHSHC
jgi:hypothetical protein